MIGVLMLTFDELLIKVRGENYSPPDKVLAFDPGETCGWAYFEKGKLRAKGQITVPIVKETLEAQEVHHLVQGTDPDVVVIEDYKVYAHKAQAHTWDSLYTPKLIGYIQCSTQLLDGCSIVNQMASTKQFCSNDKLKQWGYYQTSMRHANDAIRHGCYYLLFHGRGK